MKQKIAAFILAAGMLLTLLPRFTPALGDYTDVPADSWAKSVIDDATEYGLMNGMGDGTFGYGMTMTRAEFITVLCRMFSWQLLQPETPSFSDVRKDAWYYTYVETALQNGAIDQGQAFSPDIPISREDMAVMLVRGLGYQSVANQPNRFFSLPFTDVTDHYGYIAVAYDIGMVNGTSATTFEPDATAKREEAAAMLVRIFHKYDANVDWLHGYYAFSSYSQRYMTDEMDAVSFGWGCMEFDWENGAWLNTGSANNNDWRIPDGYGDIISYVRQNGAKMHLDVYMDTTGTVPLQDGGTVSGLREILTVEKYRTQAVQAILGELDRIYPELGENPYSGVSIDFESLKGAEMRAGFTAFLSDLSAGLKARGKTLYVAVQAVSSDGMYYDGFDYAAIGELADKVILMAHDYNAVSLSGFEGTTWYKTTAMTPISEVYCSLRAITDPDTGVKDKSKIALAVSISSLGWYISEDGKLLSPTPVRPSPATVYKRAQQPDTVFGWSEEYQNAYMIYRTEDGQRVFLWYENSRSVNIKIELARMFGVTGLSLWRIGTIPDYDGYSVWQGLPLSSRTK